uniref:Uncharacterized protein n=1 Tax=Helianthus annuus TaxID=4232 RepID=A0A251S9Z0_HELAN
MVACWCCRHPRLVVGCKGRGTAQKLELSRGGWLREVVHLHKSQGLEGYKEKHLMVVCKYPPAGGNYSPLV